MKEYYIILTTNAVQREEENQ